MSKSFLLKIIAVLWIVWGLVHAFAGIITIYSDTPASLQGILDGVEPALLEMAYHPSVNAVINQHGWNLLWFGVVTTVGAFFIWRDNDTALWVTALVGGLADIGYFLYLDLGGFVNFVPGTVMTIISASAIVLSVFVYLKHRT
ncbi:MAG: hypothetical protein AAGJ37_00900 [Pseudomonadota bacterium]